MQELSKMRDYIILGAIQGVVDWLPISSEGVLVLSQMWLFDNQLGLSEMIKVALFLHLGSLFAVIVYFWSDIGKIIKVLFNYKKSASKDRSLLNFLLISSIFTGTFGLLIYLSIGTIEEDILDLTGQAFMILIGFLLLITSGMQFIANKKPKNKIRDIEDLTSKDAAITGLVQSAAVLPGFSRSGSTVSTLLLLKINDVDALKISFFMGLPVILGGNIILNFDKLQGGIPEMAGLMTSFIFGILTIHFLMKIARKLSFAWFTLVFGFLTISAAIVSVIF